MTRVETRPTNFLGQQKRCQYRLRHYFAGLLVNRHSGVEEHDAMQNLIALTHQIPGFSAPDHRFSARGHNIVAFGKRFCYTLPIPVRRKRREGRYSFRPARIVAGPNRFQTVFQQDLFTWELKRQARVVARLDAKSVACVPRSAIARNNAIPEFRITATRSVQEASRFVCAVRNVADWCGSRIRSTRFGAGESTSRASCLLYPEKD